MTDNRVEVEVTGNSVGVESTMNRTQNTIASSVNNISNSIDKMNTGFGGIVVKLGAVGLAIQGAKSIIAGLGGSFDTIFKAGVDFADQLNDQSEKLAMTTEELSRYGYAAQMSGSNADAFNAAIVKFNKNISDTASGVGTASETFDKLGVSVTTAEGALKSNDELLKEIADQFQAMPNSANKTAAAISLFGKSGAELIPLLNGGSEGIRELADEADRLGVTISSSAAQQAARFNDNLDKLTAAATGLSLRFSQALVPAMARLTDIINNPAFQEMLQKIGEFIAAVGEACIEAVETGINLLSDAFYSIIGLGRQVLDAIGQLVDGILSGIAKAFGTSQLSKIELFNNMLTVVKLAFLGVGYAVEMMVIGISNSLEIAKTFIMTFVNMATKALKMDFTGAKEAWDKGLGEIDQIVAQHAQKISDTNEKYKSKAMDVAMPSSGGSSSPESSSPSGRPSVTPEQSSNAKTRSAEWSAELENIKMAYAMQNNLRKLDIQEEINYWNGRLAQATAGTKEYQEVTKRINEAKLRQMVEAQQMSQQMAQIEIERAKSAADAQLNIDRDNAAARLNAGQITQSEYLSQLQQFEERRYAIAHEAIMKRAELLANDPSSSPAERARINAEIEALDAEHAQRMNQINILKVEESRALWTELSDSMSSLWDKGLQSMMNGTLTWANAYRAVLAEVGRVFVNFAAQKAKAWLQSEVLQTVYTRVQTTMRTMLERMGLMQSTAMTATSATTKVGANAAVAGSGAASAMASIPYIGPILAIAAMAAMIAAVGGLKGSIKSARSGFDIPSGMNPMTQLHEEEMVLPKEQANAIRDMTGNGGMNVTIQALDGASVRKLLLDHGPALAESLKRQYRSGGGNF
jgi:ABC-type transporter Mla subunit MlaD